MIADCPRCAPTDVRERSRALGFAIWRVMDELKRSCLSTYNGDGASNCKHADLRA
jgi:hypothetical protein